MVLIHGMEVHAGQHIIHTTRISLVLTTAVQVIQIIMHAHQDGVIIQDQDLQRNVIELQHEDSI